jgi:hypothetical protein
VYKLRKVLYGLKQAPRAWYGRLRGFLFERGFEMGKVDQTLFLLRQDKEILFVQVYMDDIVFGGLSNSLVARFARLLYLVEKHKFLFCRKDISCTNMNLKMKCKFPGKCAPMSYVLNLICFGC